MRIVDVLIEGEEALGVVQIDQGGGELLLGGGDAGRVAWLEGIFWRGNPGVDIGPDLALDGFR